MRNKKLIFAAALILMVSVVLCVFAGCQKTEDPINSAEILMSFEPSETKSTVKTQELTNLKGYTSINSLGDGVLSARKYDEINDKNTYIIFDIEKNKVIATSERTFDRLVNGIYYTAKVDDNVIRRILSMTRKE